MAIPLKIYMHIGTHKTGSSSLQSFFKNNREKLAAAGVYVPPIEADPKNNSTNRQDWKFCKAVVSPGQDKGYLKQLAADIRASNCQIAILSDEDLESTPRAADTIRAWVRGNEFDASFIFFVRPQHEYANSIFQQNVRMGSEITAQEFFNSVKRWRRLDYGVHFNKWAEGESSVTAIPFNTGTKKLGVVSTFFDHVDGVNVDALSLEDSSGIRVNESVTHGEVLFFQSISTILSNTGSDPQSIKWYFSKHRRLLHQQSFPGPKFNALTSDVVDAYESYFKSSNRAFCQQFFPGKSWEDIFSSSINLAKSKETTRLTMDEVGMIFGEAYKFIEAHPE